MAQDDVAKADADVAKADADVAKADVAKEVAAQLLSSGRERSSSRGEYL